MFRQLIGSMCIAAVLLTYLERKPAAEELTPDAATVPSVAQPHDVAALRSPSVSLEVAPVVSFSQSDASAVTFPIRARGIDRQGRHAEAQASAVALGDGNFITVAHLTEGFSRPTVEVEIDGAWKPVSFQPVAGRDLANVTLAGGTLPKVTKRSPQYMERVFVYGLASSSLQCGFVSDVNIDAGNGVVSLEVTEPGTTQGDSGCAVFGEDGAFLGTVRSHNPSEKRAVYFTPVLPSGYSAPVVQQVYQNGNCVNGQCPVQYRRGWF